MSAKCQCCGQAIKPKKPAVKKRATISLGKGPSRWVDQRKEYNENLRIKRGELVWSPHANGDRFGARGGFVTPEQAAEYELAVSA
jgi:hypothetical protein